MRSRARAAPLWNHSLPSPHHPFSQLNALWVAAGGQLNNRYLKQNITLQWLLDNPPEEEDPYSPQLPVGASTGQPSPAAPGGTALYQGMAQC